MVVKVMRVGGEADTQTGCKRHEVQYFDPR